MIKKLFLIDGLAGAGKSDLIEFVAQHQNVAIIPKFTTRTERYIEEAKKNELNFVTEDEFSKLDSADLYSYDYAGKYYGFYKSEILDALDKKEYVFAIVRNRSLIEQIKKEFVDIALVVPIYIYADKNLVVERLRRDGFDDEQIQLRIKRSDLVWADYLKYPDGSMRVIINNSDKTDFHRKLNSLLEEFATDKIDTPEILYITPSTKFELIKPLVGFKEDIVSQLQKYSYEKNIFLMMKFRDSNYDFYQFIKTEVERAGYNCVRADESSWDITGDVYNPLAVLYCCKYGIALFDEPEAGQDYNPNVAYELGIMHYQKKECLILRHKSLPQLPFDLISKLREDYSEKIQFQAKFTKWLTKIKRGY